MKFSSVRSLVNRGPYVLLFHNVSDVRNLRHFFRAYEIQLQVISSDSRIEDSELSDVLVVHTDWATIDFYQQMYLDTHGLADDYDLANYLSGRGAYYNELNDQCGEIKLTLVDISEDEIVFRVVDFDKG